MLPGHEDKQKSKMHSIFLDINHNAKIMKIALQKYSL
jgi:hypothetical protein